LVPSSMSSNCKHRAYLSVRRALLQVQGVAGAGRKMMALGQGTGAGR
jgi:hypothetical protein